VYTANLVYYWYVFCLYLVCFLCGWIQEHENKINFFTRELHSAKKKPIDRELMQFIENFELWQEHDGRKPMRAKARKIEISIDRAPSCPM
jgi:hypothetical protein